MTPHGTATADSSSATIRLDGRTTAAVIPGPTESVPGESNRAVVLFDRVKAYADPLSPDSAVTAILATGDLVHLIKHVTLPAGEGQPPATYHLAMPQSYGGHRFEMGWVSGDVLCLRCGEQPSGLGGKEALKRRVYDSPAFLQRAMENKDHRSDHVEHFLASLSPERRIEAWIGFLNDEECYFRYGAAKAFEKLAEPTPAGRRYLEALEAFAKKEDCQNPGPSGWRLLAASAHPEKEALLLSAALRGESEAAEALGGLQTPMALASLRQAALSPHYWVRKTAVEALARLP